MVADRGHSNAVSVRGAVGHKKSLVWRIALGAESVNIRHATFARLPDR